MSLRGLVHRTLIAFGVLLCTGSGEARSQSQRERDGDRPIGRTHIAPDDIERYVRGQGITTVEGFMDRLDPMMVRNYTLMEHSASLQSPTTAAKPRLILFRPDGRFFVGIATNPASGAYEDVEILALDNELRATLKALSFDRQRFAIPTLHDEQRDTVRGEVVDCSVCHGPESRPIWGSYGSWTGAFGVVDKLSTVQAEALTRLLTEDNPDENPRLRKLYFTKKVWTDANFLDLPDRVSGRPTNESMNEAIAGPYVEHLWRRVRAVAMADLFLVDYLFSAFPGLRLNDDELRGRLDARIDREWRSRGLPAEFPQAARDDRPLLMLGLDASRDLDLPNPFDARASARLDQQALASKWTSIAIKIGNLLALRYLVEADAETQSLRRLMAGTPYVSQGNCLALNRFGYTDLDDYRVKTATFLWNLGLDEKLVRLRTEISPGVDLRLECMFPQEFQERPNVAAELQGIVRRTLERYP